MAEPRTSTNISSPGKRNIFQFLFELLSFIVFLVPNILSAFLRRLWPPKSKSIDGAVVLVTGAGGGLGRELALGFARWGAVVACVDGDKGAALETAEEIIRDGEKARAFHTDVSQPGQIAELSAALTKDLGAVDILVLYHGSFTCQRVEDISDSSARATVEDNFLSHVRVSGVDAVEVMVREFLPKMKQRGKGHIVSVTSMAAHNALMGAAVYTAASWAVQGFMESVRSEVLLEGLNDIRFTLASAAMMDSSLSKSYFLNPIQRLGTRTADQVAAAVVAGVRRNQVHVGTPQQIYDMCALAKMLPTPVVDWALKLFSARPKPNDKTS